MKLKRISLLATAAAVIASISATKAQALDWQGIYIGGQVGYATGEAEQPYGGIGGSFTSTQADADLEGWTIGGRAGFNWTFGSRWVFGVEGDVDYSDISGDDGGSGGDINGVESNWQASVRARGGFLATPNLLLFGTAGWTYMDAEATVEDPGEEEDISGEFSGWTYGLGGEWAFSERMSGTLEWRHDEYDQERFSFPSNGYDEGISPDLDYVRVGVNWHLGG